MKTITVDFSKATPEVETHYGGELGEHQAVTLNVIPEANMQEDEDIAFYYLLFKVEGGLVSSRTYDPTEDITCALWGQLTEQRTLEFQLIGTNGLESIIAKSPIVKLFLGDALEGTVIGIDDNRDSLIAMIGAFNQRLDIMAQEIIEKEGDAIEISMRNSPTISGYSVQEINDMISVEHKMVLYLGRPVLGYIVLNDHGTNYGYFMVAVDGNYKENYPCFAFYSVYDEVVAGGVVHHIQYINGQTYTKLSQEAYTTAEKNKLSGIESGAEVNVQSDWSESDSSADSFIKNKPDLSVYARSADLADVATSGDYADLSNQPDIPQQGTIEQGSTGYATGNDVYEAIQNMPTPTSDQLFFVTPGTTRFSEIVAANRADKICVVENYINANGITFILTNFVNDMTGDYAVFSAVESGNKLSYLLFNRLTNQWTSSSETIPLQGTISSGSTGYATGGDVYNALQNIPTSQEQADYAQTDTSAVDYIKNKPDLSVYAESADLASVATSGSYNDLINTPTIPSDAEDIDYDNTDSGLTATDVQAAIDELASSSGGGFVVSDTAPSDTGVLWIDPSDDTSTDFPQGSAVGDLLVWSGTEWVARPKWQSVFQPVEYIESTGTQYINTKVKGANGVKLDMKIIGTPTNGNAYFGALDSNTSNRYDIVYYGNLYFSCGNGDSTSTRIVLSSINDRFVIEHGITDNDLKLDGTIIHSYSSFTNTSTREMTLFARNDTGTIGKGNARIYSCTISKNGEIVRDYVPVRNVITGEIGLYDKIEGVFYTNAGTGTFIKGADV